MGRVPVEDRALFLLFALRIWQLNLHRTEFAGGVSS